MPFNTLINTFRRLKKYFRVAAILIDTSYKGTPAII